MGKKWHDQGRVIAKRNTFTDFITAAEYLIAQGYTQRDRLVAVGGSAGGLLMGAVTNIRPDLFKAVVALVPFVDVINTMLDSSLRLTVTEFEEWGRPDVGGTHHPPLESCVLCPMRRSWIGNKSLGTDWMGILHSRGRFSI
jgi:oligopeptidase B